MTDKEIALEIFKLIYDKCGISSIETGDEYVKLYASCFEAVSKLKEA